MDVLTHAPTKRRAGRLNPGPIVIGLAVAFFALLALLYAPILLQLGRQWYQDKNYSHGFLMPLVGAYLIWRSRDRFREVPTSSSPLGLVILLAGFGLLFVGVLGAEIFLQRISLLVVLTGGALWVLGRQWVRALTVPLALLIFMIPPPEILFNTVVLPLQGFAARAAETSLRLVGIPVLREGNVITLANTSLEVAEACSGIRSLISLMALAATMAAVAGAGRWRILVMVAVAVPIAVVTNAARVAGTGLLAYSYGPQVADGFFHTVSGWLLFGVAATLLGGVWLLVTALAQKRPRRAESMQGVLVHEPPSRGGWSLVVRLGVAAVLAAVALTGSAHVSHGDAVPLRRPLEAFPGQIGPWRGTSEALPQSILEVLRLSDYVHKLYVNPGRFPIWLYVGYYGSQRQGQTIHSPQNCLPGDGWSILSLSRLPLSLPGRAEQAIVNRVLISKDGERRLVLYWYQERGRVITSEYAAKLHLLTDAVTRGRTDGALVRLSSPVVGSEEATLWQMVQFITLMYPELSESLPG